MSSQDQERVLGLMMSTNKPFSLQQLQDFLAVHGLKKAAIQKALDSLVEAGSVYSKDFGKTKMFIPNQSQLPVLSKEELDAKAATNSGLRQQLAAGKEQVRSAEAELSSLRQCLTLEQIEEQLGSLEAQSRQLEQELARLKEAQGSERPGDREQAAQAFVSRMEVWRKHRGIFRGVWSTLAENLERKEADLFEEVGIDTDEAVGADFKKLDSIYSTVRVDLNKQATKRRRNA